MTKNSNWEKTVDYITKKFKSQRSLLRSENYLSNPYYFSIPLYIIGAYNLSKLSTTFLLHGTHGAQPPERVRSRGTAGIVACIRTENKGYICLLNIVFVDRLWSWSAQFIHSLWPPVPPIGNVDNNVCRSTVSRFVTVNL